MKYSKNVWYPFHTKDFDVLENKMILIHICPQTKPQKNQLLKNNNQLFRINVKK